MYHLNLKEVSDVKLLSSKSDLVFDIKNREERSVEIEISCKEYRKLTLLISLREVIQDELVLEGLDVTELVENSGAVVKCISLSQRDSIYLYSSIISQIDIPINYLI